MGGYAPPGLYALYGGLYAIFSTGYLILSGFYDEQPFFDAPGRRGFAYFSASTLGVVSIIFCSYLFHLTDPSRLLLFLVWLGGWLSILPLPRPSLFSSSKEIWVISEEPEPLIEAIQMVRKDVLIRAISPDVPVDEWFQSDSPAAVIVQWTPQMPLMRLAELLKRRIPLFVSPSLPRMYVPSFSVDYLGGMPLLVPRPLYASLSGSLFKFILDVPIAFITFFLALPVFFLICLWIILESPGNPFYLQWRVGLGGEKFRLWKFRTMIPKAEEWLEQHPEEKKAFEEQYKLKKDPRVLRLGKWLRKYSLDELPQLFNVLKGEMSLIGPRPVVEAELGKYGDLAQVLLSVKPGITGLWQVSGRSALSYEHRILLDITYIQSWSPWLDLKILLLTLPAIWKARGAY